MIWKLSGNEMATRKYIIKISCCGEYFYPAIKSVTYISVTHAEEHENIDISFHLVLKLVINPYIKSLRSQIP